MTLQKNVLEYLEGSAARFPDKTAFADEGESFTFGRMLACARAMGSAIADRTDRHNAPVAVLVDRTAATLVSFMGVLCSGNYYVPIDIQMPLPRMRTILETVSPAAIICPADQEPNMSAFSGLCPCFFTVRVILISDCLNCLPL